jgi:transporter family-2 protein
MRSRAVTLSAAPVMGATLVGVLTATQSRVVGSFQEFTSNGPEFVLVNYVLGVALLSFIVLISRSRRQALTALPRLLRTGGLRWYQCIGGVLGAWLVTSSWLTVPRLGLSLAVVSLICGLLVAGVVVDALGLGPAGRKPPTRYRLLGAVIALLAVTVEVAPELLEYGFGASSPVYTLLAFSAGCGVAVQQALNGRVSAATGQPLAAGWLNFVTGAIALTLAVMILAFSQVAAVEPIGNIPVWALTPGILGAAFVSLAAWAVGSIGVLRLGLLSVVGQIFTAFAFDLFNPMVGAAMESRTAIAGVLALLAAFISARTPRAARAMP